MYNSFFGASPSAFSSSGLNPLALQALAQMSNQSAMQGIPGGPPSGLPAASGAPILPQAPQQGGHLGVAAAPAFNPNAQGQQNQGGLGSLLGGGGLGQLSGLLGGGSGGGLLDGMSAPLNSSGFRMDGAGPGASAADSGMMSGIGQWLGSLFSSGAAAA